MQEGYYPAVIIFLHLRHLGCYYKNKKIVGWSVNYLNKKFLDASQSRIIQQIPYDRVLATRPEAREALFNFVIDLKKQTGFCDYGIGDTKSEERINQKIFEDGERGYKGDRLYVTDHERMKIVTQTPQEVTSLLNELNATYSDSMSRHKAELAGLNNLFANPKEKTGYRCVNSKIAFYVGDNEPHIVELQITAASIDALYNKTHKILEINRSIAANAQHRRLTKEEQMIRAYCDAACRYFHGKAAREGNYDILLAPQYYAKHAMTPTREHNQENMIFALKQLLTEANIEYDF